MTELKNLTYLMAGAAALALVAAFAAAAPAKSAPSFDGLWSVVIITDKGACDRAYRYPIRIARGTVLAAEPTPMIQISGRVTDAGAVTVTVNSGNKSAHGTGRLNGAAGAGS